MKRKKPGVTCAICLDECTEQVGLNACDHKYCRGCIETWFEKENSCPQCKRKVTYMHIPGRKHRKRVKARSQSDEDDSILAHVLMNYVASAAFRDSIARAVIDGTSERLHLLWMVIQRLLPRLYHQVTNTMLEDSTEINEMHIDILEATESMVRLQRSI